MTDQNPTPTEEPITDLEITDQDAAAVAGGATMVESPTHLLPAVQSIHAITGDGSV